MRRFLALAVSSCGLLIAIVVGGLYIFERPTILRVAVTRGSESQKLLSGLNQEFTRDHTDLRLHLAPVADPRAAAKAIESGNVDLAVVRSDASPPPNAATALILEHHLLVIVVPSGSEVANISDLKGKRVASVDLASDGEGSLLDALEEQYALPPRSLPRKSIDANALAVQLDKKDVDAVLAFGRFDSPQMSRVVRMISRDGPPSFLSVGDAVAMAKKNPGLEAATLLRGAFGGGPSLPGNDVETIGVTLRLVADNNLGNATVADLVRQTLAHRTAIAATFPVANAMETPDTDKGETLPTHPGAAAFIDDEEESFFDRYSDIFYVGAMIASLLASIGATLINRIAVQGYEQFDLLLEQALEILKRARDAEDIDSLRLLELQIDEILTRTLATGRIPKLDGHQLAGLTLAVEQARLAIKDRRQIIIDGGVRVQRTREAGPLDGVS